MCNNTCNCAANFERLNGEIEVIKNLVLSIHAMVTEHIMKKEDVLDGNHHVNDLEKQGVESSMNIENPVITPTNGGKFLDKTFETMCSKQPCDSPFIDLPSQEFGCIGRKTTQRNYGSTDEVFPLTGMELPKTLENLCFTKSYFRNGIVTIRDCPITLHNTTIKHPLHKIQKKLSQGKRGAKVRSSTQYGGRKSRMKKCSTEKYDGGEEADSDKGSCAPNKDSNFNWEKKYTQVRGYICQHFSEVVEITLFWL